MIIPTKWLERFADKSSLNQPYQLQYMEQAFVPLSYAQERLWFLDQLVPGSPLYNIPVVLQLSGSINVAGLEHSLKELVQRHQVLCTTFAYIDGQPYQVIASPSKLSLPVVELTLVPENQQKALVMQLATQEAQRSFDLAQDMLLRTTLLQLEAQEHVLLLTMHHIVSDAWSIGVFIRELTELYTAFCTGQPSLLPELPIQYADFAIWQRQWLQGKVLQTQLSYWQQQLAELPILQLPTDRPRPPIQTFRGATQSLVLSQSLTTAIKALTKQSKVTLFITLLAAFKSFLHRYTGQEDIVVGSGIANRTRSEINGLVGFFVNTIVLRTKLSGNPSFYELLGRVRKVALEAYTHQDLPFEKLVKELRPERDLDHTPLFQVMFVLQNAPIPSLNLPGLILRPLEINNGTAKFDLTLNMMDTEQGLLAALEYNTDLFDAATVTRMLDNFSTLLESIVANPNKQLSDLQILTEAEQRQLLVHCNSSKIGYSQNCCIYNLFERQVEQTPDAIAVVFEKEQLTYQELNQRANQLAHYLRLFGVGPEVLVGICVERSLEMVIAFLGILKAGGAYVPLDPAYPKERLAFILADAQVSVLLTQQRLALLVPAQGAKVICLDTNWNLIAQESDENPLNNVTAENLAYVIYTSGSTGKPKGVLIRHSNVVRLFEATQSLFNFNKQDVWTLFHSYAFDFSTWELCGALLYGGRLVIVPYLVTRSPETFYDFLCSEQVTILNQTPSAFRQLIRAEEAAYTCDALTLRLIIFGGEALEIQSLKPWFDCHGDEYPQLVNMYGITETTVHVTYRPLTIVDLTIPLGSMIGSPIRDLQVYILDQHQQLVPIGVSGEMYVGGAGLASGYLNAPNLTAERFIPHPYSDKPGVRLYKTGDLARYLPNGQLQYLSRIDHQVKIRGFRIELGEIEAVLGQHSGVRETVVLAREDVPGDKQLVAYIVSNDEQASSISDLRKWLKEKLPEYMIPAAFVLLKALPLTPNGKVDRQALPIPGTARPELESNFVAPRTLAEKMLTDIWATVLHLEKIGIYDNFFALGGDSIRSIQVQAYAKEQGLSFSLQQLFQHQTIHALIQKINPTEVSTLLATQVQPFSLLSNEDRLRLPDGLEDAYPLTMLQAGMLFHSEYSSGTAIYHNINSFHLRLILDPEKLQISLQQLATRHPVLRTSFNLSDFSNPMQLVYKGVDIPLHMEDLRHLSVAEQEEVIAACIKAEKICKFDWTKAPLLRFQIHRRSEQTFQFTLTEHHAILDGWSVASMLTELFEQYFYLIDGRTNLIKQLKSTFRNFVALEQQALNSQECRDFWLEKLKDSTITKFPRWPSPYLEPNNNQIHIQKVPLPPELSADLRQLAHSAGVPLKSVLLAAHLRVLSLLSGQSDVITGLVSNGRLEETDGERVLGLFLNTLPFRLKLTTGTWIGLVQETFKAEQELLAFRRYPMAQIQQEAGGQSLFETGFNFTHFHVFQSLQEVSDLEVLEIDSHTDADLTFWANFDVDLSSSSQVNLTLEGQKSELCTEQMKAISGYYAKTLIAMGREPFGRYESQRLLSEHEWQQLLEEWNANNKVNCPQPINLHQMFEAQVVQTPEAIAVVFEDQQLTYQELNARANQLAHYLQTLGVGCEVLVGLCVERSLEMIIGLLGILKAGGAYLPLDPTYPQERLAFMLSDSQVSVLLTQDKLIVKLPEYKVYTVCLDTIWGSISLESQENPISDVQPENLLCVIYTSGSTGKPKGVMIQHQSLVSYIKTAIVEYGFIKSDRVLQFASISFDAAAEEIYTCLCSGGTLVLRNEQMLSSSGLMFWDKCRELQLTILDLPTAYWHQLIFEFKTANLSLPDALRLIIIGGERVLPEQVRLWQKCATDRPQLINVYGPTEATLVATTCELLESVLIDPGLSGVPIGRPISNIQVYILNQFLEPVPICVPGELYIGGAGLVRGYLNRPDITAERFIPNPFSKDLGACLYKTGDLARYRPDGNIEYLGRLDHQVKIRGFRVEMAEIEAALVQHPEVRQSAVILQDQNGNKRLVAYIVPKREPPTFNKLRCFLLGLLPEYMVPANFIMLETLPLMPSGKVDRGALPILNITNSKLATTFVFPSTPIEEEVAGIWAEVLGLEQVGIHDNFFELGGHSLLATQVISRLRQAFQVELLLRCLFESPTVAALSKNIEMAIRYEQLAEAPPLKPVPRDIYLPLSFAQQRLWFLDQLTSSRPIYNMHTSVSLKGLLDLSALEQSLNEIVRRHEILRTTFANIDGQAYQVIAPSLKLSLSVVELSLIAEEQQQPIVVQLATQEAQRPFNLAQGALLRIVLLQLKAQEFVLMVTMHHIVSDGWSIGVFIQELAALYAAFSTGQPSPLPELPIQYADFAYWQRKWLHGEVLENQLNYWKQHLGDSLPTLQLPTDRPRPAVQSYHGAYESFTLSLTCTEALKALSREEDVTLFMTLLAAFQTLLHRYTNQDDIVIGADIANRNRYEIERLIGFFVNMLVLRTNLSDNPSFQELLKRIRKVTLEGYTYQDIPFEKLVEKLQPERNLRQNPLFQVVFVLQNTPMPALKLPNLTLSTLEIDNGAVQFDLVLSMEETEHGLVGSLAYNKDLFDASTIKQMVGNFKVLLRSILDNPEQCLADLPILSKVETAGYTYLDFPDAGLNQKEFESLVMELHKGLQDI